MRPLLSLLAAASLLTATVANANQCARPAEKVAFDVEGLKSQLMVTAITCQQQSRYNAFIARYRADLVSDERAIDTYFHRAFGRSAQRQRDEYITLLANAQSDQGIKLGTLFCQKSVSMFDEVMALRDFERAAQLCLREGAAATDRADRLPAAEGEANAHGKEMISAAPLR